MLKPTVVLGLVGTILDRGKGPERWSSWRPTVDICRHDDLVIGRLELLHGTRERPLAAAIVADVATASPETLVRLHEVDFKDPWDFGLVYGVLHDFAAAYPFDTDREDYLVHVTTGTHVAQICLFLLTETRYLPARLLQSAPPRRAHTNAPGSYSIIDLDLSKYDQLAARFQRQRSADLSLLKGGIETRSRRFNELIARIEQVAGASPAPILLTGPTGAGKTRLAKRIYQLKKLRQRVTGPLVEVNCATVRGDAAMSALFGHVRGAFTGAERERAGLLRSADGGVLFLDEIGELGADEQAALLRAIEDKVFLPLGSDREVRSDFQLIAGTNTDLAAAVRRGRFREDLLARINLWTFQLPGLRDRPEDLEPNLDHELAAASEASGSRVAMSRPARERFLAFAASAEATWAGNFRDFSAAIVRMAALAPGGRISEEVVDEEIERLRRAWRGAGAADATQALLEAALSPAACEQLDAFDRVQLAEVLRVCATSASLSDAGRRLFGVSRSSKTAPNDADRLRKYLARFALEWKTVKALRIIA